MNTDILINKAKERALNGEILDRQTILSLLAIDPASKAAEKLGECARDVAAKVCGNTGKIWASIGVDYQPCTMNCGFCSFGEKWAVLKSRHEWDTDKIAAFAKKLASGGAKWITLRTTEFYEIEKLCALARKVRSLVPGDYQLVANTGEFDQKKAKLLLEAGFQIIYHSLRLREGINTPFTEEERCATLETVMRSDLDLAFLVEPAGVEHSNEELADVFLTAMRYEAKLSGAMARVPVPGTPLYRHSAISERRLAQLTAVTRLAAGYNAPDICVHPPSQLAVEWGANVLVVETGAIPRDTDPLSEEWNDFDIQTAKAWFHKAGYDV